MLERVAIPGPVAVDRDPATQPPVNMDRVRQYRLDRLQAELRRRDISACVLTDPLNVRYATDSPNMQLWVTHNFARYAFVPAEGPVVMFDFHNCGHRSAGLGTVDSVRHATGVYYFAAGPRLREFATRWAAEIDDLLRGCGGANRRLALDRAHPQAVFALTDLGIEVLDAGAPMEQARAIKSADEVLCMREAIRVAEAGMHEMHTRLEPGMTENELWSMLHRVNIALGGEWIETRLLTSGSKTNPWFQECGFRVIEAGDLVSYDTDLIGPFGYCADISRSFLCGDGQASDEQRRLYATARDQIAYNLDRLRPGMTFREYSEVSYDLPDEFRANRYSVVAHGIGLCDEYPHIAYVEDVGAHGYDGDILPGMTLCIESYVGAEGGREGVKLEEQVLVTDNGIEVLSTFPFEDALL